ncbi:MAG TPA: PAS domain S-box protein, partial [Thermoplasmatales archaeon]|nr:PAS domain S-box protein [Thermoplasmatales archaeon]
MLYRYYKENVGVKKKQSLYILIAIPSNAVFSFLSYIVMEEMLNMAQFPLGSTLDFLTLLLILYAIVRFKLPVETPAEIDFRILAETATEGICIVDRARRIEYANDYLCKMFCISKNKILGKNFFEFVAENYRDKCEEKCKEVLRKGNTIRGLEVIFECGEKKIIGEINASPIKWNNEIIGCFITIRDIGEKKRMEEELRRQKTYFQALFESSPEAIVSLDEKHRVMDINKAFRNLFGYSIEELKGKNIDD